MFCSIPVHTIFDSCPEDNGIRAMAITRDARYLATISDAETQVRGRWDSQPVKRSPVSSSASGSAASLVIWVDG